jgi:membrane associated rhomboid family serine protease
VPLFIIFFLWRVPAVIFIGLWFLMQFVSGVSSLGQANLGGVAWWAHVGGFLLGMLIAGIAYPLRRAPASSWSGSA